jgi:hypothetical protein
MPRSCIQIHGETLAAVRRYFQFESRSLKSLRQIFVLALYDFATSGKKIEEEVNNCWQNMIKEYGKII